MRYCYRYALYYYLFFLCFPWISLDKRQFEGMEREIQAEFQNLHRFLDEEEEREIERLRKEKEKRISLLKERERKISMQGRNLEKAIETLNSKLQEEDSPRLLKVSE